MAPIFGKLTPSDVFAFEISELLTPDTLSVKYDADNEQLTAKITFQTHYFDSRPVRWLETYSRSKKTGQHIGVTPMGVKFKVTSYVGTSIGIGVKEQIESISIVKQFTRAEALKIKPLIRVYAIAALDVPYKLTESTGSRASLDSTSSWLTQYLGLYVKLKAICLVNARTGEIIAKSEAPFPQCTFGICV